MYGVQRVAGGYQVWHREEYRPVDDQYLYLSRQNAYVRRDQLNEMPRGRVYTVCLTLDRKDCTTVIQRLKETFGDRGIEFLIIDPLNDRAPEVREITFKYRCASPNPEARPVLLKYSRFRQPRTEEDLVTNLEELAARLPLINAIRISPGIAIDERGAMNSIPYHVPYTDDDTNFDDQ